MALRRLYYEPEVIEGLTLMATGTVFGVGTPLPVHVNGNTSDFEVRIHADLGSITVLPTPSENGTFIVRSCMWLRDAADPAPTLAPLPNEGIMSSLRYVQADVAVTHSLGSALVERSLGPFNGGDYLLYAGFIVIDDDGCTGLDISVVSPGGLIERSAFGGDDAEISYGTI